MENPHSAGTRTLAIRAIEQIAQPRFIFWGKQQNLRLCCALKNEFTNWSGVQSA
jgi:hypothetical protein